MKKYAQIVDNKVHGVFDYEVLPEFAPNIIMVDITNLTSQPNIGDTYDGNNFIAKVVKTPTLDKQKQGKIKQLQDKYQKMYDDYLSQYPKREIDSFAVKQAEAIAYTASSTAPTPIIDALVNNDLTLKDAYVASVMAKVTALAQQEGQMVAIRDRIKACTTQAELDAISF